MGLQCVFFSVDVSESTRFGRHFEQWSLSTFSQNRSNSPPLRAFDHPWPDGYQPDASTTTNTVTYFYENLSAGFNSWSFSLLFSPLFVNASADKIEKQRPLSTALIHRHLRWLCSSFRGWVLPHPLKIFISLLLQLVTKWDTAVIIPRSSVVFFW